LCASIELPSLRGNPVLRPELRYRGISKPLLALTGGYRQNKSPFAIALGDWFLLRRYVLTNKASPNDSKIVIVIVIRIIGEAKLVFHGDGIIAQTVEMKRVSDKKLPAVQLLDASCAFECSCCDFITD
jgi:hypothetical protein